MMRARQERADGDGAQRLEGALEALMRPLDFAAADDFGRLPRMGNLEGSIRRACETLRELSIPTDLRRLFAELDSIFSKEGEAEERRGRIAWALEHLEPLRRPGWEETLLARPLTVLPGVGPKRAQALAARGIARVGDLLYRLPSAYDDRRRLVRVDELQVGVRATFLAQLRSLGRSRAARRPGSRALVLSVADESGSIELRWFRGADAISRSFEPGDWLLVSGEVRRHRFSKQLIHPDVERVEGPRNESDESSLRRIVPRYATPEGVGPRVFEKLVSHALDEYADLVRGHLPRSVVAEHDLPSAPEALRALHRPAPDVDIEAYAGRDSKAHRRLVLEELHLLELGLALRRERHAALPAQPIDIENERVRRAHEELPFRLTGAQARVWQEIRSDLARPHPMNRLLQGDVGCGKTVVALLAARAAEAAGMQTALMAPTELLAEQHARSLRGLLGPEAATPGLRVGLLTASLTSAESARVRAELASGAIDLIVGTHALIQSGVEFARLGLAVIDEQHRFGVRQRATLSQKCRDGLQPHTLVMTATPIPRTLAMTLYGDLDVSVIDELPPGRSPVQTLLLREGEGRRVAGLVREAVSRGEQTYVVYPLVEESEQLDLRAASESALRIARAFPEAPVDLLHGRLSADERARVMQRFEAGETRILVSTTVIEVGVDVASACLMIVEHAERFGLAQLHQLRGRVGRGERPGTCVLVARGGGQRAEARLRALLETNDGFRIAETDLMLRGPGEFLGTQQSGVLPDLHMADLVRDVRWVRVAREAALESVRRDPGLRGQPVLRQAVELRWGERLDLAGIA